jgi:hypothetical protein
VFLESLVVHGRARAPEPSRATCTRSPCHTLELSIALLVTAFLAHRKSSLSRTQSAAPHAHSSTVSALLKRKQPSAPVVHERATLLMLQADMSR